MEELCDVITNESGGVRWTVCAGYDPDGGLQTLVHRTGSKATAESGMGGPPLQRGQLINTWIGKEADTPYSCWSGLLPRSDT